MRRTVLAVHYQAIGPDMPFTLESALHYRRVKMLFDRGFLPDVDPAIQHPEGIRIREIDAVASEPVQAWLARWFPEHMPFPDRIRWIEAGWYCLGIPLLALALRIWTGSWLGGFTGGALYGVMLATVLRSTGQEISRENFALPFLMAAFVFAAASFRRVSLEDSVSPRQAERIPPVLFSFLFAVFMSFALTGWDMIQYVIAVITLGMSIHLIRTGPAADRRLIQLFRFLTGAVFLLGLLHPYHRFHGLAYSPLMIWMAGVCVAAARRDAGLSRLTSRGGGLALIIFAPVALVMLTGLTGAYGESYNHFGELLWAKIRFLNEKPDDPSLLTFYQRIMWTPALHSATWALTKWMFPLVLWVVLFAGSVAWLMTRKQPDPLARFWLLFFGVSVIAYVIFVRFHVFAGLGVAVCAGWMVAGLSLRGPVWRVAALLVAGLLIVAEARHTWTERERMGRPNVYYDEMQKLADWLRKEVAPEPVLANMGVSAYIGAYAKCPIVIHPKFEDPSIRRRLERYGEIMFGADELTLRDWMDDHDVRHIVYAKGEFADRQPEYQMRYFVNQLHPPDTVPARRFEQDDPSMRYFTRLWGNHKYVVYQSLDRDTEHRALLLANEGMAALQDGRLDEAEESAIESLGLDRQQSTALKVMRHVGSLREQGVQNTP